MKDNLPKGNYLIDLHLHADGALSLETVLKLADMQGITLPTRDPEGLTDLLTVPADCRDLNEYLERFALPCSVMQTRETLSEAFYQIKEELKRAGLIYAEIRFAPQLHLDRGLTQEEVVLAALEGCNRSDLRSNLILCCMRGNGNEELHAETLRLAAKYKGKGVAAVDLAGAEALFPTADYEGLFARAKELGLVYTIHAGEADGPESVKKALDFGASRIGHGIHSVKDEALMKRLKDSGVPLEICVTSNLHTKIAPSIEAYPLKKLLDNGIVVTINTDNPTVSNTTTRKELHLVQEAFGLTNAEVRELLMNSVRGCFADGETKAYLARQIEEAFQ